jgi:hypothetical protein
MAPTVAATPWSEQATTSWRNSPRADFTYEQSGQPRSEGFENVRGVLVPS